MNISPLASGDVLSANNKESFLFKDLWTTLGRLFDKKHLLHMSPSRRGIDNDDDDTKSIRKYVCMQGAKRNPSTSFVKPKEESAEAEEKIQSTSRSV
uniref:Uncharacterized protein n=1 Tax=Trichogramma kaykai TaxID=54128 RepID=A0ABD2WDV3_9HYME